MYAIEDLITVQICSARYNVESSFIETLHEYGLIEIVSVQETLYVPLEQLLYLEKFIRLHFDLNINMEGLDVISALLSRVNQLQTEIKVLETRLSVTTSIAE